MGSKLNIDQLKPGMVIVQVVAQNGPVKIRKSGLVTSMDMVLGLAEMGVQTVEIDPEQTVEIESPVVEKSQTQKLLERDYSVASKLDHSLSEQFNRSLFLPSVQDIPNVWQYYGKQLFVAALVLAGGFGIGWSAANYPSWLSAFTEPAAEQLPVQRIDTPSAPPVAENTQAVQQSQTAPTPASESAEMEQAEEQFIVLGQQPQEPVLLEQGEPQTQPQTPTANISPELLKRFEEAVAAVDQSPEPADVYQTDVVSMSDVPKIHELPANILTRLPSMAFSAHMYASEDEKRWVRVNGMRVSEGEYVEDGLQVVKIEPQHVVMAFRGEEFVMAALTDW